MIEVIEKNTNDFEKCVLIIGVMHGEEPQGEFLINKFIKNIKDETKFKNKLIFVPCVNQFGLKYGQRTNENGVDLNRNYPTKNWELTEKNQYFGGQYPASEYQTKFLIELVENIKPDCILSIHAPYRIVNYDGDAKKIAEKISQITGYPVESDMGYPTPGSFGTYFGIEKNIPVITLELPEDVEYDVLWKENCGIFDYFAYEY